MNQKRAIKLGRISFGRQIQTEISPDLLTPVSHMTEENPRILFLHYWGRGSTTDLAKSLKAALDTQKH
jgi:hypothetical protein